MTSIPSATAASIAATMAGEFAFGLRPVVRLDEDLVVPDVRTRRHARGELRLGRRVEIPGGDACDVCAVARVACCRMQAARSCDLACPSAGTIARRSPLRS